MKYKNAGYKIIAIIPLNNTTDLVIGKNPRRAARYVVWRRVYRGYYSYYGGGYCATYRQALSEVARRIEERCQEILDDIERGDEDEDE